MSFNVADIANAGDEFYAGVGEIVAEGEEAKASKGAGTNPDGQIEGGLEQPRKRISLPNK